MCDEIGQQSPSGYLLIYSLTVSDCLAGTLQYAQLRPELPASFFPAASKNQAIENSLGDRRPKTLPTFKKSKDTSAADEIFDDDIDDQDLLEAGNVITTLSFIASGLDRYCS